MATGIGRLERSLLALPGRLTGWCWPVARRALAQGASSFVARVDRTSTDLGDPFVYEVTLSMPDGRAEGYQAPDFRGFRVLGEYPSQSTQIQMGGGSSVMRTVYTWRYELSPPESGRLTISPARVRVRGKRAAHRPGGHHRGRGRHPPAGRGGLGDRPKRTAAAAPPPGRGWDRRSTICSAARPIPIRSRRSRSRSRAPTADSFIRVVADKRKVWWASR